MERVPRVLVMTRLFSGLIDSVVKERWNPTGIPAIYKVIEGLNREEIKASVLFLCKTEVESRSIARFKSFRLKGAKVDKIQFNVVPFRPLPLNSTKLNAIFNDLLHLRHFVGLLISRKIDVVYCDRSNIMFGAIAAAFFGKRVVLRLLGFYPDMKALLHNTRYKLFSPITYLSYFAPFKTIICTQDDSGGGYYLDKIANRFSEKVLLLNGVNHRESSKGEIKHLRKCHGLKNDWPILLYVGKLEKAKGCLEFIQVMSRLAGQGSQFYGLIIGDGPLADEIRKAISVDGLDEVVKFIGPVVNSKMSDYYNLADVYVHLYLWASLTNTVLESMRAGNALVLISPSDEEHIGQHAKEIIPDEAVILFDRHDIVADLSRKLVRLLENRHEIERRKNKMKEIGPRLLSTWDERIEVEMDLIRGM